MDLRTRALPGNEAMPNGRIAKRVPETLLWGPRWVCQTGMSGGQEDGVTEAGLYIATEGRRRKKGAVRFQLRRWEEREWV